MIPAVYLVDDDETTRFLGQIQYSEITKEFHSFENAQLFEEYIQSKTELSGLIILDLNMPVMDGKTFLKRNTTYLNQFCNLKLILCSSETLDKSLNVSNPEFEITCISKQDVLTYVTKLSNVWK